MHLKKISISGYRLMDDTVNIDLDEHTTIIAGANNSGKTSIIELFNTIFGVKNKLFTSDDFSIKTRENWGTTVTDELFTYLKQGLGKEECTEKILALILGTQKDKENLVGPSIEVKIEVGYDKEKDDIRNFANYTMELDEDCTSFFFVYSFKINKDHFRENFANKFEYIQARHLNIKEKESELFIKKNIQRILTDLYTDSCKPSIYFTDKTYKIYKDNNKYRNTITKTEFKELFNYQKIMAGRTLDDENTDRTQTLSKSLIEVAQNEDTWSSLTSILPDQVLQLIEKTEFKAIVKKASTESLAKIVNEIAETSGGHLQDISIGLDPTEDSVESFLKNITSAKIEVDEYLLKESSQGLGFSNLIYIYLQLDKFKKTIDKFKVNFFVIEEPEAHMHPQMQRVFAQHLYKTYEESLFIQGLITTHSHEVVKQTKMPRLRIIKKINQTKCKLYDLAKFYKKQKKENHKILDFYNLFYIINFSNFVFADKIIMYEGDTERVLIKKVLENPEFKKLLSQYLSFVQVGGAYAYKYKNIITFLEIKTAILSDIDYKDISTCEDSSQQNESKSVTSNDDKFLQNVNETQEKILDLESTNATINNFYRDCDSSSDENQEETNPTVKELYEWQEAFPETNNIVEIDKKIALAFQGKQESCARTLEEAMLAKLYDRKVFEVFDRADWTEKRKNDDLKFSIPHKDKSNIKDIVKSTSNNKTDFMYSVIMSGKEMKMLPNYIIEALKWLQKEE